MLAQNVTVTADTSVYAKDFTTIYPCDNYRIHDKTWFTGGVAAKQHPKRKAQRDSPKNVEEFIEVCPNLDPEDAENLRKEDESSKREERKKS
jgi:hypothetical protein